MTTCQGCSVRVYRLADGLHDAIADGGALHVCADQEKRECVVMSVETMKASCPCCGSRDVAESTWGRLVEWPGLIGTLADWIGPLRMHVCEQSNVSKRVPETYRVYTDGVS